MQVSISLFQRCLQEREMKAMNIESSNQEEIAKDQGTCKQFVKHRIKAFAERRAKPAGERRNLKKNSTPGPGLLDTNVTHDKCRRNYHSRIGLQPHSQMFNMLIPWCSSVIS